MSISKGEKIIIYMLAEVYKKLGIEGEIDPDFMQKMVVNGSGWGIDWHYNNMFDAKEDDPAVLTETTDILSMFTILQGTYLTMKPEEQDRVKATSIYKDDPVRFPGFDANEEPHFGVATTLINDLGRFADLKGQYINSHSAKIDKYRRMRTVYERALKSGGDYRLTVDDVCNILAA